MIENNLVSNSKEERKNSKHLKNYVPQASTIKKYARKGLICR